MKRRGRGHVLAALLFTDIVGSSEIASEFGDRRWRALLDRHHAIVRSALKRFGGRELDTAGDGFFAVFDEPSDAIRCACAISDGVRELGIEIRAGLNIGEVEMIDGKLGGIAVHAAARIMAQAGPGEVLVSSTVRDLVPGSGFGFTDRGTRELRGIPGGWHLFEVTAVDGTPRDPPPTPEHAAERRSAIQPPPLLQRRSGRIVAVGLVGVTVAAVVIAVVTSGKPDPKGALTGPSTPSPTIITDRVLQIDPSTGKVIATIPVGKGPSGVAFGDGSVWVTNTVDGTVSRIDPTSLSVRTVKVGHAPHAIVFGAGAVWVGNDTDGTVTKIDPGTDGTTPVDLGVGVGSHTIDIAVDDATNTVWASIGRTTQGAELNHFTVGQIDTTALTFAEVFQGGCCYSAALTGGEGSIWLATDNGRIVRLDARSGHVVKQWDFHGHYTTASLGGGSVWVGSAIGQAENGSLTGLSGGSITPFELATNAEGDSVPVGGAPSAIAITPTGIFVSDATGNGIVEFTSGIVKPLIPVGGSATGIAAGEGFVWVSVDVT